MRVPGLLLLLLLPLYAMGHQQIPKVIFILIVNRQLPDLYPVVKKLDDRLTKLMAQYGGGRIAKWTNE